MPKWKRKLRKKRMGETLETVKNLEKHVFCFLRFLKNKENPIRKRLNMKIFLFLLIEKLMLIEKCTLIQ